MAKAEALWRTMERVTADTRGPGQAMRPLRVAGVDPEHGFSGGETQVMGLTLELLRRGHDAELLCDPGGLLWQRATGTGIRCRPLPVRNALDLRAGLALRRLLHEQSYDVVHFHTSKAHALAPYARAAGALIVTRRMDYRPNRLFAPWLFNHAVDGIVAISAGVASALAAAGVARDRISIIPSGVDTVRFAPPDARSREQARRKYGLGSGQLAIGAVGALQQRKGHRFLIEAIALMSTENPSLDMRCILAGDGPLMGELQDLAARLGVADAVRFTGRIGDAKDLLAALDIFAMPSLKEGLGVAALEAMACGLPIIASSAGGLSETVAEERTGLLVPPGDSRGLALAITRLAAEPPLRAAMGEAARVRAVKEFALETTATKTIGIYRGCLARRRRQKE
jgi:glycosyltransferase involved in cell wall biosynthesis